ncbi:hypothetical protein NY547_18610 [Cnuibacter physcomitrellae]|uniref:hypothetical protein n=1 Tax=Cnuibacter physcomitrellae TaxID=1619308 RepID=UPI002175F98F|nr:hypothetical protein [Cnuibacter physcomitrellae]MCS5499261.1 hypothetical protein [Cnuibacter physcomitrellae]
MPRTLTALLLLLAVSLGIVIPAASASAAVVTGHGVGFLSKTDRSWIGSYLSTDGTTGLCLDVSRPSALGSTFTYEETTEYAGLSLDDLARVAYIGRVWASTYELVTAAAAQLAIWRITGLDGHDAAYYAQRANEHAAVVLSTSDSFLAQASRAASRSVTATLGIDLASHTVTSQLVVDLVGSGPTVLAPGVHDGVITLQGATFGDGSTTRRAANGVAQAIIPDPGRAIDEVSASVGFTDLPYGATFTVGRSLNGRQDLLQAAPVRAQATAEARASGPSPLPFSPEVVTRTSSGSIAAGETLSDDLVLSATDEGLGRWGVYQDDEGFHPVPVVIESVLYGPLKRRPEPLAEAPADAPVVCRVETAATEGPGTYRSPGCAVAEPGWYTWTAAIDPARTPPEHGGDRLGAWSSSWGEAAETTLVLGAPTISTVASRASLDQPACVHDTLSVSGLPVGAPAFTVTATLIGPDEAAPTPGAVHEEWRQLQSPGAGEVTITGDGEYSTDCVEVSEPGYYHFVISSPGSTVDGASIPAFEDAAVHASESFVLQSPPPSSVPSSPAARLASTGQEAGPGLLAGVVITALGAGAWAALRLSRPSRSARS